MSGPVIQIRSLHKEYHLQRGWKDMILRPRERDTRVALDGIDLEVERGEFFGVLGQNGAGKTTLFKILATLIRPDRGSALVCGVDVEEDPARVRDGLIPVIPAERSLYWRLSAYENLRLYASLYGLKREATEARIRDTLEMVGLNEVGRKQVGLFSSGMKQRLLIGRALLGDPEILLLDEPTRSLDPLAARAFRTFLKSRIGGERGTTILLATHDHEEVTDLCERVAVLDEGKLLAVGPTETLLSSALLKACSIWTPSPDHPDIEAVVRAAGGTIVSTEHAPLGDDEPWHRVRIQLPTDEAGTAEVLASMISHGVTVSRFTRDDIALADLLSRVTSEGNDLGRGNGA